MKDFSQHLHMDVTAVECQTLSKLLLSLSLHLSLSGVQDVQDALELLSIDR